TQPRSPPALLRLTRSRRRTGRHRAASWWRSFLVVSVTRSIIGAAGVFGRGKLTERTWIALPCQGRRAWVDPPGRGTPRRARPARPRQRTRRATVLRRPPCRRERQAAALSRSGR